MRKCSRLVILPEWQSLGVGIQFLEMIAARYTESFKFIIITGLKGFIGSLNRSDRWRCYRHSRQVPDKKTKIQAPGRMTASFVYLGDEEKTL